MSAAALHARSSVSSESRAVVRGIGERHPNVTVVPRPPENVSVPRKSSSTTVRTIASPRFAEETGSKPSGSPTPSSRTVSTQLAGHAAHGHLDAHRPRGRRMPCSSALWTSSARRQRERRRRVCVDVTGRAFDGDRDGAALADQPSSYEVGDGARRRGEVDELIVGSREQVVDDRHRARRARSPRRVLGEPRRSRCGAPGCAGARRWSADCSSHDGGLRGSSRP